jgi:hypothetical protein
MNEVFCHRAMRWQNTQHYPQSRHGDVKHCKFPKCKSRGLDNKAFNAAYTNDFTQAFLSLNKILNPVSYSLNHSCFFSEQVIRLRAEARRNVLCMARRREKLVETYSYSCLLNFCPIYMHASEMIIQNVLRNFHSKKISFNYGWYVRGWEYLHLKINSFKVFTHLHSNLYSCNAWTPPHISPVLMH